MPSQVPKSPRPVEGSQPSITANTMISISPTQKVGSEKPRIEPAMMARLAGDSGLRPAYMPSGMPTTTARMKAANGELERRRHALQDELERRLAEHERVAEIAAQRVAEEVEVLLVHRQVEARAGG
jgi:hypothetical protein